MVVVYISPNKKLTISFYFLHETLFPYSHRDSTILKYNKHELPSILAEGLNVNFAKDESMLLITFLQKEIYCKLSTT